MQVVITNTILFKLCKEISSDNKPDNGDRLVISSAHNKNKVVCATIPSMNTDGTINALNDKKYELHMK